MLSNFWDAPLEQMIIGVQEILLEDDLIELDTAVLESYAGEYHALLSDGSETTIRISRVGNHLIVVDSGSNFLGLGFLSLYPISPERFILKTEYGWSPRQVLTSV